MLFQFYLAAFKLAMTFNKELEITDTYPLNIYNGRLLRILQDFMIPFFRFLKADFYLSYTSQDNSISGNKFVLNSSAKFGIGGSIIKETSFEIIVDQDGIESFLVSGPEKKSAKRIS